MSLTIPKTDSQIKSDVLEEFKWDPAIDEAEIGVQVKEGIVTLTGNVNAFPKRLAARDAAHRVYGVLDVVDDMKVKLSTSLERTDEDVTKAVRNALCWDTLVPDEKISSTVSKGIVTLQGNVDTYAQREDAEKAVRRLNGVKGLINQIRITAPSVDPVALKAQIERALERQTEREAKRIGVSVHDGVVVLTGTLRSWTEKNTVARVALFTPGVQRVENQTVVEPYC